MKDTKDTKDEVQTAQIQGAKDNYANSEYIKERLIPSDQYTAIVSSERDNYPLTNAFDGKDNTYWVAKDINTETFKNYIIFRFKSTKRIEAFLYYTAYSAKNGIRLYDGFPLELTVYTSIGNEYFKPACVFTSDKQWPDLRFQFVFPQDIICDKLKIEFTRITNCESFGLNELVPASGEITLISKLTDEFIDVRNQINGLFTDYAQFNLVSGITSAKISELREKATKLDNYEKSLRPILDRAEAVITGQIKKDPHREFSTKPGSKNQLEQKGNSISYCRNILKFQKYGCNSQVIGIGGTGDKPITVFVDVEPLEGVQRSEVKLPRIKFSQINGTWQLSFKSEELKLGRNDFTFYNFVKNHNSYDKVRYILPGGPIHVENPYTLEEQKGHVTLYFEQGYVYPVFRDGDDEGTFKVILQDYYNRFKDPNDDEITISAFELCSNHFIASAGVKLAYDAYVINGLSPQKNLDKWDDYLMELLRFSGVVFTPGEQYYDPRNEFIRENYRSVQEWAGAFAFAAGDMVGLPYESTQQQLTNLNNPGWAMAHETGHALDKSGRIWTENTNNMWSMHNLIRMDKDVNDKLSISEVTEKLSSDFSEYVTHANGKIVHCSKPVVWWILEGACPGYWPTSENMYSFESSDLNDNGNSILQVCERNIYYACLATKKNLCAYFERFGFYFKGDSTFGSENNLWTYEKSTDNFKNLLQKAIQEGRVVDECPKYWYVNLEHYRVLNNHNNKLGSWATCYSSNDEINHASIKKLSNCYFLTLPEVKNSDAHLCYEIQSFIDNKWQVVGSTYSQFFNDNYPYPNGAQPKYRIIGYDRNFHTSKALENTNYPITDAIENVAKIGEKLYTTLQAALDDVKSENEIVYILKSFSTTSIVFKLQ